MEKPHKSVRRFVGDDFRREKRRPPPAVEAMSFATLSAGCATL
jgi:hypothetical protein